MHHHSQPQVMDMRHNDFENEYADPPYFERLETNEYIELQESRRIIEVLHHRVRSLENINIDLEYRLEQQAKATFFAEQRYVDIDKTWKDKFLELKAETDEWQNKYVKQVKKTERIHEHLNRTERELYGILQRKYQLMRGGPHHQDAISGGTKLDSKPDGDASATGTPNVHSLKQILSLQSAPPPASSSTPLSDNVQAEELSDIYKKLPPELRSRRFLMDMGDFLGI